MSDMTAVIAPKSDQISADSLIAGDMTIRITGVKVTPGQEQPVSMTFDGSPLVFRPCKSMARVMVAAWGPDSATYVGRALQLYRDPSVKWGGMEVGGIRIRKMTHIDSPMTMALTATKGQRKPYVVQPLVIVAPASKAADEAVMAEARTVAAQGTDAFRAWFKANPAKRPECSAIMPELQKACADADADAAVNDDPFGLPPIDPAQSTDAEISAQIAAEIAARDRELEGQV